jgi:glycosyltransferase involved in cell wall biosynthesis
MIDLAKSERELRPATMDALRKLKIGISIWSFTPNTGGLQAHAEQLCRNLMKRGHEVVVVTRAGRHRLEGRDYLFFNEPESSFMVNDVPVKPLKFSKSWLPVLWFLGKCVARPPLAGLGVNIYGTVARKSARNAFAGLDIIHHVGEAAPLIGFAAAAAAQYWRIPFVVQPTCHPYHVGDSPLDLRLFSKANRLLVHTEYEADYFRQKGFRCPMDVVGNGIEDRADGDGGRFRKRFGITGPFILFIGRKDLQKGYPLLLDAFKTMRSHRPDISLVCMGPAGPAYMGGKVEGLTDLEFASEDEKHDALAACACLCVPSEGESFGLVFMEAGLYGKPVIGRNVAVLQELWKGGEAGLMLGTPDRAHNRAELGPQDLASALLKLFSDPAECQRLGDNLRKVSEQFVWPRIVERFEASYYKALSQARQIS